jgi:RecB family exonuclease
MPVVTTPEHPRVMTARGARAAESAVLAEIDRLRPRAPDDLALPARVVVPSASLRHHILRRLAEGGALVGVVVQTLHATACEVLARSADDVTVGDAAFDILVRRHAAAEPELKRELDGLQDGYAVVAAAVRDLLDAGFEPAHQDAIEDKLADLDRRVAPQRLRRVTALVRVAAEVADGLTALGVLRPAQVPQRAMELLQRRGPDLLPSRAVIIHGFADATGVATDFIHALLVRMGGVLVVDRPPDPAVPERENGGAVFLDRFALHFSGVEQTTAEFEPAEAAVVAFEESSGEAEVRRVAHRIRALLDEGVLPESIAVAAREISSMVTAVRRQFDRLAIPFSGAGATVPGGAVWREARLLAAVLRSGDDLPAELWLEALEGAYSPTELMLALRTLGIVRTAEVAKLRLRGTSGVTLPLALADENGGSGSPRVVPASEVKRLADRAAGLLAVFDGWPKRAAAAAHATRVLEVLEALGWSAGAAATHEIRSALDELVAELPTDWTLTRGEFVDRTRRRLESLGDEPVGGCGGGVQLLSAMEARARTFDHLYVLALNRGRFPRVVREDALLPDTVRGHLAAEVLPEFPVKARGIDEERYLFAQLMSSSPRVTISWRTSEDGSRLAPSPFVERLCREGRAVAQPPEESADSVGGDTDLMRPSSAFEHAMLAAAPAVRASLGPILAAARAEGHRRAGLPETIGDDWARARLEVLDRIDPLGTVEGPGPWAGLVGGFLRPGEDLPSVTALERLARCPLQGMFVRRLGLSPMPDPRHGLPDTRGALVGELVHRVLQRIVDEALDRGEMHLGDALELESRPVVWPNRESLELLVHDTAERIARRHGLIGSGVAPLFAAQALPYLEVARRLEWGEGVRADVLTAEVSGDVTIDDLDQPMRFRADRIDRQAGGQILLDYKTGRPPWGPGKPETRRKHLLRDVSRGRALQGVAYALASGGAGCGRYLYLAPNLGRLPEESRDVRIGATEEDAVAAFHNAVLTIAEAWRAGGLPPRVEEADGKNAAHCGFCTVSEACLRDDSGYRRRLVEWLGERDNDDSPVVAAARDLWWLGVERPESGG